MKFAISKINFARYIRIYCILFLSGFPHTGTLTTQRKRGFMAILKTIGLLFQLVAITAQFLVWRIFTKDPVLRKKRITLNPARLLQDEVASLQRTIRTMEDKHQASIEELERRHQKKLKRQAQLQPL